MGLKTEASELTVRNNIFTMTGGASYLGVSILQPGISPVPDQVRIYNNTCFSNSAVANTFACVDTQQSPTNVSLKNNLARARNTGITTIILNEAPIGAGFSASNNSTDVQVGTVQPPFATDPPVNPVDYKLGAGYAKDGGVTAIPVFSDFFRVDRPVGAATDIGATEQ